MNLTMDSWAGIELLRLSRVGDEVEARIEQAGFSVVPDIVLAAVAGPVHDRD